MFSKYLDDYYGYINTLRSSRKLEKSTYINVEVSDQGHLNDMVQASKETLGMNEKDTQRNVKKMEQLHM